MYMSFNDTCIDIDVCMYIDDGTKSTNTINYVYTSIYVIYLFVFYTMSNTYILCSNNDNQKNIQICQLDIPSFSIFPFLVKNLFL
jgi:hypothetical protein